MIQGPVEIRHLRYFLAVAGAGSFSRAADRLGISQPSVSQQMRELEENLRVSLFQRRGKRILLTAAGLIFQEHARAILRQLENFSTNSVATQYNYAELCTSGSCRGSMWRWCRSCSGFSPPRTRLLISRSRKFLPTTLRRH